MAQNGSKWVKIGSKWPKIESKWVKMALGSTGQIKVTRVFLVCGRIGRFSGARSTAGGVWSAKSKKF